VVEGQVALFQAGQKLYTARHHEAFGVLEVLARAGAGVEARAEVDTVTLEIATATFLSVLEDHHAMTVATIRGLCRRLLASAARVHAIDRGGSWSTMPSADDLDLVGRVRLLRSSDLFVHARAHSLAEVASQFEELRVAPGTVLWRADEAAADFVVLLD